MRGLCVLGFSDQLGAAAHSHFCVASLNFVLCRCIRVGRRVRVWELCVLGFSEALDAALHRSRIVALSFVIEAGQQARGERKDVRGRCTTGEQDCTGASLPLSPALCSAAAPEEPQGVVTREQGIVRRIR